MNNYKLYLESNKNNVKLSSGKAAFKLFLKIIDDNNNEFTTNNYLNKGKFSYFFYTDTIKNVNKIIKEFKIRLSLETAYKTLFKLKDKKLSFFFAIDKFELYYGFYDDILHYIYKVGKYKTSNNELKKLPIFGCIRNVNKLFQSENIDLKKTALLKNIQSDFKKMFPKTDSEIKIVSNSVIKKRINLNKFKKEDQDYNLLLYTLENFIKDFNWSDNVISYIELTDIYVYFYIKVVNA